MVMWIAYNGVIVRLEGVVHCILAVVVAAASILVSQVKDEGGVLVVVVR
jgi:hypothetical protein